MFEWLFSLPVQPIWIGIFVFGVLVYKCRAGRRWPTEREVVEIITLSWGLSSAVWMLTECFVEDEENKKWMLFIGSAVVGLVSTRGIWTILMGRTGVNPQRIDAPPPTDSTAYDGEDVTNRGQATPGRTRPESSTGTNDERGRDRASL